jgi:predicted MFS family arabinose efflux permease
VTDVGALLTNVHARASDQDAPVRKLVFWAYTLCILTMVFCVNAPVPLFEVFRRANGLSPSELSMLYTVYAGIVIVALPVFGRASDRFGRRALVVLGLGFLAIGSLALAGAGNFLMLVGGRCLQGLGIAAMSAPAASALAELAGAQRQAFAASIVAAALAVGGAAAPLFSGVMAEAFSKISTLSLVFCAGMALFGLVTVALLPDPWPPRHVQNRPPRFQFPAIVVANARLLDDADATGHAPNGDSWRRIAFWQACTSVLVCFGAQVTFFTVSGPLFSSLLASHVLLTAGCAMSALMVASGVGSMLASCFGAKAAIASSMGLLAPGVCCFFGLVGVAPVLVLTPAIVAIGLGHGLGYAGALRLISETAYSASRAAHTSKFYVAIYVGGGVPVLGMGVLEQLVGRAAAYGVFCLVIALIAIGVLTSLWLTGGSDPKS